MAEEIAKDAVNKAIQNNERATDLVEHVRSLSVQLPQAQSYLAYSGPLKPDGAGNFLKINEGGLWSYQVAQQAARDSNGLIGIIDNTEAGKVLLSRKFEFKLIEAMGEQAATALRNGATGPDGKRIANGLVDEVSANFFKKAEGPVGAIAPFASETGVLRQTEFMNIISNNQVPTFMGAQRAVYEDIIKQYGADHAVARMMHDSFTEMPSYVPEFKNYKFTDTQLEKIRFGETVHLGAVASAEKLGAKEASTLALVGEAVLRGGAILGKGVKFIPIVGTAIGVGVNSAEASELNDKLSTAVEQGLIPAEAKTSFTAILGLHATQGADPSIVGGEAAVQYAYNQWADIYNVQGNLRDQLQPTSLALMAQDFSGHITDATADVAAYAAEQTGEALSTVATVTAHAYADVRDAVTGERYAREELYAALPRVEEARGDALEPTRLSSVPPEARALMDTKADIEWTKEYIARVQSGQVELHAVTRDDMLEGLQKRMDRLEERFRSQYAELKEHGGLRTAVDYTVNWHQEQQRLQQELATRQAVTGPAAPAPEQDNAPAQPQRPVAAAARL